LIIIAFVILHSFKECHEYQKQMYGIENKTKLSRMNEIDDKKFVINVNYMYILKYVQWFLSCKEMCII